MSERSRQQIEQLAPDKTYVYVDFADVYRQHKLTIYRYILVRIGHVEDAHDLTAQVFLKAYQHNPTYRHEAPIVAWLIGIARHQIVDYYREQKPHIPLSEMNDFPTMGSSLEESVEQRNRLKRVAEALTVLSEDRREALAMRLFAGLKNQEIADLMGKSPDAVAMLVYRGVQDLKIRLSEEDNA